MESEREKSHDREYEEVSRAATVDEISLYIYITAGCLTPFVLCFNIILHRQYIPFHYARRLRNKSVFVYLY